MTLSGAQIDGYVQTPNGWVHLRTGAPLAVGATVTLRVTGGPVLEVNPVTRQVVPGRSKTFEVIAIDGGTVSFRPTPILEGQYQNAGRRPR